jgi:hypothetical protein
MRENEPVLLVLSTYDGKLFLRKVKFYLRNVTHCHDMLRKFESLPQYPTSSFSACLL